MSNFIKHIKDFEHDDNMRSGFMKHVKSKKFKEHDNFVSDKAKHILKFEKDDNFRGKD